MTALRTLRILRPLKTIAKSEDLKVILQAIISSIPMLLNILIVLGFFVLVMAIAGTQLFKGNLLFRCTVMQTGEVLVDDLCHEKK